MGRDKFDCYPASLDDIKAAATEWRDRAKVAEDRLRKVEAARNASVERMKTTQAVVNLAYLQDDLSAALAAEDGA